jgi:HAD superfamily hydrolase (TIGR01490 family)
MSRQVAWPRFESPPAALFLDVDGTLLAQTTTFLFARLLKQRGFIDYSYLLRVAYHGLQHKFGRLDYGRLLAFGLRSIRDIPISELEPLAQESFQNFIVPRLYEGVVEHIAELRAEGSKVVLVSSSPRVVLQPLGDYLGAVEMLTTPVKIEDGRIIGPGEGPRCYGDGKLVWAEQWAAANKVSMDESAAYADNWSDRALLQRVGRAVVVHPHGRLLRMAKRRGWSIIQPRRPARVGKTIEEPGDTGSRIER